MKTIITFIGYEPTNNKRMATQNDIDKLLG